ncbi:uracil-DNA glycosylase-like protein, partial [Crassisporium funariophilum]
FISSPGEQSSLIGHHYGNPTNHFWSCLHESGLTTRRLRPKEDGLLPEEFSIGLMSPRCTNLVGRPTVKERELSKSEQVAGVQDLLQKIGQYRPRMVCFVGLGIADIFKSQLVNQKTGGKSRRTKATNGLQSYKMVHSDGRETVFFAVPSTSGRVVRYQASDRNPSLIL